MPTALGQRLLLHQLFGRGVLVLVAIVVIILLIRFGPAMLRWWRQR
ncbi:MAG: hypothetical protein JSU06_12920 [Actinobacteria bacterium]|nr:hypothetical protein [Actinomycetota bacterium]